MQQQQQKNENLNCFNFIQKASYIQSFSFSFDLALTQFFYYLRFMCFWFLQSQKGRQVKNSEKILQLQHRMGQRERKREVTGCGVWGRVKVSQPLKMLPKTTNVS